MIRRLFLAVFLVVVSAGCGYNSIQSLDEGVNGAKGQIEVQLQRRADLVPNLAEAVRGYAAHEEEVFTRVAEARAGLAGAIQGGDPARMAVANSELTGALSRLLAIAESYPELKASDNFLKLQDELAGTENRIAVARTDYNESVRSYNEFIRKFPAVLTAKITGAKERGYFEVTSDASREAPRIDFGKKGGG